MLGFNKIPLYGCLILSFGTGLVVALLTRFLFVPHLRRKIDNEFELNMSTDFQLIAEDENTEKGI